MGGRRLKKVFGRCETGSRKKPSAGGEKASRILALYSKRTVMPLEKRVSFCQCSDRRVDPGGRKGIAARRKSSSRGKLNAPFQKRKFLERLEDERRKQAEGPTYLCSEHGV